ncbi:MAG: hypothetical protein JNK67_01430 [Alphaproteobacteria bacterium]|nr:hypothetical protein [Alphaproteobacteria bacterium]
MPDTHLPQLLFSVLIGMVVGWFVLCGFLLAHLKRKHPDIHAALGSPSLFMVESDEATRSGRLFMLFILRREHRPLGDIYLSILSDFALVCLGVWFGLFLGVLAVSEHPARFPSV